mmetsp:Transcript_36995/g.59892  ORF Transcript_36995/g.59892 Transcript_36995/m.59892 type:complete len:211 (+) Transcript_36995:1009-1641(+)
MQIGREDSKECFRGNEYFKVDILSSGLFPLKTISTHTRHMFAICPRYPRIGPSTGTSLAALTSCCARPLLKELTVPALSIMRSIEGTLIIDIDIRMCLPMVLCPVPAYLSSRPVASITTPSMNKSPAPSCQISTFVKGPQLLAGTSYEMVRIFSNILCKSSFEIKPSIKSPLSPCCPKSLICNATFRPELRNIPSHFIFTAYISIKRSFR